MKFSFGRGGGGGRAEGGRLGPLFLNFLDPPLVTPIMLYIALVLMLHFESDTLIHYGHRFLNFWMPLLKEGGVRVCGDAVLRCFWCGFAVIFILSRGIAVSKH